MTNKPGDAAKDPDIRKSGLGGSDMAAVLGVSPWSDPFQLYAEKLGLMQSVRDDTAMMWGTLLEDSMAEMFTALTGKQLQRRSTVRHKDCEWAFCHPDRKVLHERSLLETKTSTKAHEWGEEHTDEIPVHYLVQVHHQMWVCNMDLCYVAVGLLHNRQMKIYHVHRDPEWDALLQRTGEAFWNRVVTKDPPTVDFNNPATLAVLKQVYGVSKSVIALPDEAQRIHERAQEFTKRANAYSQAADCLKAELLDMMRDAWLAKLPDGTWYRRQVTKRKGYTVEPSEHLDFRHIKNAPKGVDRQLLEAPPQLTKGVTYDNQLPSPSES